jgi:sulfate permease, SulP family
MGTMPVSTPSGASPTLSSTGRDLGAALVVSLAALSFYVSSASLIFQGSLASALPAAIGAALLGGGLLSLVAAWRGSLPQASAGAVPVTVSLLAAITSGIASQATAAQAIPTAVVALALTSAAMGATWWLMGDRGWGAVAGYIPYPVIGGLMAAAGWLVAVGGLGVATGARVDASAVQRWLSGEGDVRLAAAVLIGLSLSWVGQRFKHPLVLPLMLAGSAGAVHTWLFAAGWDLDAARSAGWLPPHFDKTLPIWPAMPSVWTEVRWDVLSHQAGWIVSCVIVSTLSLMMTASSLEVAWETRGDINRDLRALGQGNLLAAIAGGLAGGMSLSRSLLNRSAGAVGRSSGVMLGVLCLLAMVWGGPVISLIPLPLLGGLLLAQGLDMMKAWVVDSRLRLGRRDYLTVVAMVAVTALLGFLPALCLGVLACCVNFAVSQSQFSPVRRQLTRAGWLGTVERPAEQAEWLLQQGSALHIVQLQGVLFFGSALRLAGQLEALLLAPQVPQRLLFDFEHVRSLDSSAAQALARLFKSARARGIAVEVCGLHGALEHLLRAAGALAHALPDHPSTADAAIGAWDESALKSRQSLEPVASLSHSLSQQLGPALAARLLPVFEVLTLSPGQVLFDQGSEAEALYLVASGRLAIVVPEGDRQTEVVVRTVLPGSSIGEMGLFRNRPRSATVRAVEPTELLALRADRLATIEAEDPTLAAALYRLFVLQLASRLDQLTVQAYLLKR